jgi:hypothetical protein
MGTQKKKMAKGNHNQDNISRDTLVEKMKIRMNSMQNARKNGSCPQLKKAVQHMSSQQREQSKAILGGFQQDLRNLNSSKTKQYLNSMLSGMNENQFSSMSEMVKNIIPGSLDELGSNEKINQNDMLYVPWADQTEQEKLDKSKDTQKGQKAFSEISITVPKITDMGNPDEADACGNREITKNPIPTKNDIDLLFEKYI